MNPAPNTRTYTVAIAVTVGKNVLGHDMVTQSVPAGGKVTITTENFASSTNPAAVCAPITSMVE